MPIAGGSRVTDHTVAGRVSWLFPICMVTVALVAFLAPVPEAKITSRSTLALFHKGPIAMVGNSIVDHVSLCDKDKRTLPSILSADVGADILDLSYGGEPVGVSANFAVLALDNRRVKQVILAVSLPVLSAWDAQNVQQLLFFKLVNPGLGNQTLIGRVRSNAPLEGPRDPSMSDFSYKGTHYPGYEGIKDRYLSRESEEMACPEHDGEDLQFVEAYYEHIYNSFMIQQEDLDLIASAVKLAQSRGKRLYVVIMPIDFELMGRLNPSIEQSARLRVGAVVDALQSRGVFPVDLSGLLHNSAFADRWCACGHLLEDGRRQVAQKLAEALQSSPKN